MFFSILSQIYVFSSAAFSLAFSVSTFVSDYNLGTVMGDQCFQCRMPDKSVSVCDYTTVLVDPIT